MKFLKEFSFKRTAFIFREHKEFSFRLKLKSTNKAEFLED